MIMKLPSKIYDWLKWAALLLLPSLAVFYGVIGKVWGLPYVEQIVTTLNALGVLVGTLIGVSTLNYNKENTIIVEPKTKADNTFESK
jgi:hypothetical protein